MSWRGSWITTGGPRSILGRRPSVNASCVSYRTLACALKWNNRNGSDTQQSLTHQGCSRRMPVLSYAIERMKIFTFVLPIHAKETRGSVARFPSPYAGAHVGGIATCGGSLFVRGHDRSAPDGHGPAGRGGSTARAWLG